MGSRNTFFPRTVGAFYRGIRPYGFILFLGLIYTGVLYYLLIPALLVLIPRSDASQFMYDILTAAALDMMRHYTRTPMWSHSSRTAGAR